MKIENIKFKVQTFDSVEKYSNSYILLNYAKEIKYLTFKGIKEKINKYEEKIFNTISFNLINNEEISQSQYYKLLDIFVDYFEDNGFPLCNLEENFFDNKSLKILSKKDIINLSTAIYKFHIFYRLYKAVIINEKITDETKELMKYLHINNIDKDVLLVELHKELKQYNSQNKNIKFELQYCNENKKDVESFSSFYLICNDWYALSLYNMIYDVLNAQTEKTMICQSCGKLTIRINNRQLYCKECAEEKKKYNSKEYYAWKETKRKYNEQYQNLY